MSVYAGYGYGYGLGYGLGYGWNGYGLVRPYALGYVPGIRGYDIRGYGLGLGYGGWGYGYWK
jgi:hypothetical protein